VFSISLKLQEVSKHFNRGPEVLTRISLKLEAGKTVGLFGDSGSGKSTLALILAGLERPSAGKVAYHDRDIHRLDRSSRKLFRQKVQILFQDPEGSLNPLKTIAASFADVFRVSAVPKPERPEILAKLLERLGLAPELLPRRPAQLSGGQNQRVALGRILLRQPEFIILDEPTSALDPLVQAQILLLLQELQRTEGFGYLIISHDPAVLRTMTREIYLLDKGRLIAQPSTVR
jgi:peptide/nickel transport system ATP-binding protein